MFHRVMNADSSSESDRTRVLQSTSNFDSTQAVFHRQLDALENIYNVEVPGSTVGERFQSLSKISSEDREMADRLSDFATAMIRQITEIDSRNIKQNTNIFTPIVRLLAMAAIKGAATAVSKTHPSITKKQHWLPVVYIKQFGRKNTSTSKHSRTVTLPGVFFHKGSTLGFNMMDSQFIHETDDEGYGFYEDPAEKFFSAIEGVYGNFINNCSTAAHHNSIVIPVAMFVQQSVRNPYPSTKSFHYSKLSEIVDAIIRNMDMMQGEMYAVKRNSAIALPLAPYVPPCVLETADKNQVFVFPVQPKCAVIISSKPMIQDKCNDLMHRYKRGVINRAQKENGFIIGISRGMI